MTQTEAKRKQIQYLSYVLGALSLLYFSTKIGYNGLVYFILGLETVCLFSLFSGDIFADAYGKFIRVKRSKGQYKTVHNTRFQLMLIHLVVGLFLSLLLYIISPFICGQLFQVPLAEYSMKILAFVILFRSVSGVLLGYFQGNGNQFPTAVNAIIRQLLFFILGNVFCNMLSEYGNKVSAILRNEDFMAMYGVIGLAVAYLLTEVILLLFNLVIYYNSDRDYDFKKSMDGLQKKESIKSIIMILHRYMRFNALGVALTKLPVWFLIYFFTYFTFENLMNSFVLGSYYRNYLLIGCIPALLCISRIIMSSFKLNYAKRNNDIKYIRDSGAVCIHYAYAFGLFWSGTFIALMPQFNKFLGIENTGTFRSAIPFIGLSVLGVCVSVSALNLIRILQDVRKMSVFLIGFTAIWIGLLLVSMFLLKNHFAFLVYSFLGAVTVLAVCATLYIISKGRLRIDSFKVFVLPIFIAAFSGFVMFLVNTVIGPHMSVQVCLIISIIIGFLIYMLLMIIFQSVNEKEISFLYGKTMKRILLPLFRL